MLRQIQRRCLATNAKRPRPKMELDPSFTALMQDINASLKHGESSHARAHQELEVLDSYDATDDTDIVFEDNNRKSPAAAYGSKGIGAVILPTELHDAISSLIDEADKHSLREDAKRLFQVPEGRAQGSWDAKLDVKYKSYQQRIRHAERDGTAFASIALPAHYGAIFSVLQHAKHRIGSSWRVDRVVDWGAATGSSLWAALHTFQKDAEADLPFEDIKAADSTIHTYMGMDKRDGLVDIGKRILRNIPIPPLSDISFRRGHPPSLDFVPNTLAISAFSLSTQPSDQYRKRIIKEMWASGAETMIIIDHANKDGFAAVLEGRHTLLALSQSGSQTSEDGTIIIGDDANLVETHIVAPCPHERECPLLGSKLHCSFSQRLQRPEFLRRTKHSGVGHEDMQYSYVVIRRGRRPDQVSMTSQVGRHGRIHRAEEEKEALKVTREVVVSDGVGDLEPKPEMETPLATTNADLEEALREESYSWPRLIFPPLKKGGHIILDSCTADGKVVRMTIPRSQGKQQFYDARKSSWGDIFPHPPKNPPQDRYQPKRSKVDGPVLRGADIGKRKGRIDDARDKEEKAKKVMYEGLQKEIKTKRRIDRKARQDYLANE